MALDLAVLAVLSLAAVTGALSGALRQLVSLAAVAIGWFAARGLGPSVGKGLSGTVGAPLARVLGPVLLFLGAAAAASLLGALLLRAGGLSRAVRSPADRGLGALLGGAKGALAAWVLLSAIALAGGSVPRALAVRAAESDLFELARAHNLLVRLDPASARAVERALEAARGAQRAGVLDPESARLLADPRIRELAGAGTEPGARPLDPAAVSRALEDPEIRALVERLAGRAGAAGAGQR